MKRSLIAAAAALLMATGAQAASVDNSVTLRVAGYWTAWYDPSNNDGKPMCGMRSMADYNSGARGAFFVKYVPDVNNLFVHVYKTSWSIPDGTDIPITLQFDRGEVLTTVAKGGSSKAMGGSVAFYIKTDFTKSFLELFGNAAQMTLGFREGSEPPWTLNMDGSREVSESFAKCVVMLSQERPKATQPHGGVKPTQPYANKPRVTQPFGNSPAQPPQSKPAIKRDDGSI